MKKYNDIEQFIEAQDALIQEGAFELNLAIQEKDEILKKSAIAKIAGAKQALAAGKEVLETIALENGRYMNERLDYLDETSYKKLVQERKSLEEILEKDDHPFIKVFVDEQLSILDKEIEKVENRLSYVVDSHHANVDKIMDKYEMVSVFYNFDGNYVYTHDVLLTKEQARLYRSLEDNIKVAFHQNDAKSMAQIIGLTLVKYPEIDQIAPNLRNYTNETAMKEAMEIYNEERNNRISATSVENKKQTKPKGIFAKAKNFVTKKATAFSVKIQRKAMTAVATVAVIGKKKWNNFKNGLNNFADKFNKKYGHGIKNVKYKAGLATMVTALATAPVLGVVANNMNNAKKRTTLTEAVNEKQNENNTKEIKNENKEVEFSKFENIVSNVSYNDLLASMAIYDNKANTTNLKAEQVAALGYVLNTEYLSEETEQQLKDNGVISDDPTEIFFGEVIDARDNIDNSMIMYDKKIAGVGGERPENIDSFFNNISLLATNEETKEQIDVLFNSIKKVYIGTEKEAKEELNHFLEFMNIDEPRKDAETYGFHYDEMSNDGKLATFIYAPNFLDKLREYRYDQDIIDNLQYELDNVSDFLNNIGYECNNAQLLVNKDGMGYNVGKVYGIEVNSNGEVVSWGRARVSGGKKTVTKLGGYSEEVLTDGKNKVTTTTDGGAEKSENVADGKNSYTETEEGKAEKEENVTGSGDNTHTETEEGKDEVIEDVTGSGDNTHTETEEGKDEVIEDVTGSGDNTQTETEEEKDEVIEDVTGSGDNTHTETEEGKDEVIENVTGSGDNTHTEVEEGKDDKEEAAKKEAEQKAKEEAAKKEAERKAREEAAKKEAERKAKEEAAKKEAERKAREEAAKKEAERKAREEAAKKEAERKAREEAAKKEAEQKAREEATKKEEKDEDYQAAVNKIIQNSEKQQAYEKTYRI